MPKIEAFDEAVLDSPPLDVFRAILDEAAGVTRWWMPHWEGKLRGETPIDREGAVFDITIHGRGTPRFSGRTTKIVEGELIEVEFTGDFEGTGTWKFEPTDGKTRASYRWNVKPKRFSFVFFSYFMDMGKSHSDVMRKGFEGLKNYLSQK